MRRWLWLLLLLSSTVLAQTGQTGGMLGLDQTWTGKNTFNVGITVGPILFSNLGLISNATSIIYISDATLGSNPCTGGGSGALALRINGAWNCAAGAGGSGGVPTGIIAGSALVSNGVGQPPVYQITPAVDPRNYGVVGNGSADDTTALQAAINVACPNATPGSRIIAYNSATGTPLKMKVTSTINFTKCRGVFFDGGSGQGEAAENTSGLIWAGAAGGTVMLVNQTRDSIFQNFFIDTQTAVGQNNANIGIDIDEQGTVTTITTNDVFRNILVRSHDSNTNLAAIRIGAVAPANVEHQLFDHITVDCSDAAATISNNGIGWLLASSSAQPKWMEVHDYTSTQCSRGIDLENANANIIKIDGGLTAADYTDLYANAGAGISYSNIRSENGTAQIVIGTNSGDSLIDLTTNNLSWSGLTPGTSTYTYAFATGATKLRIVHNVWDNVAVTPVAGPTGGNSAYLDSVNNSYPANSCPNFNQFGYGWSSHLDLGAFNSCPEGMGVASFTLRGKDSPNSTNASPSSVLRLQGSIFSGSATSDYSEIVHVPFYNNTKSYISFSHPVSTLTTFGLSLPSIFGGVQTSVMITPVIDNVLNLGTSGATSYTYKVVANDGAGGATAASASVTTTTGNSTLSGSNCNQIAWRERSGAYNYTVYRTAAGGTPSTTGVIGSPVWASSVTYTGYFFSDCGLAGGGQTAPAANTTGRVISADNIQSLVNTFASLAACVSGLEGSIRSVSDSTTSVQGATITGGGSFHVLAYCNGTNWVVTTGSSSGLPTTPQTGDTTRYNVDGDTQWDATNLGRAVNLISDGGTVALNGSSVGPSPLGSTTGINATATDIAGEKKSAVATASLNSVIGDWHGTGGNSGIYSFGSWYRWTMRFAANNTTNVRYWMGLTTWNNGGPGTEGQVINGTAKMATDTPNSTTLGFRFSASTDANWKAVALTTGGSQTTTDTGVAIDTIPHKFDVTFDGTSARYFIDGVLKATITTNVPAATALGMFPFWCGDNKNNATAIAGTLYWMTLALK